MALLADAEGVRGEPSNVVERDRQRDPLLLDAPWPGPVRRRPAARTGPARRRSGAAPAAGRGCRAGGPGVDVGAEPLPRLVGGEVHQHRAAGTPAARKPSRISRPSASMSPQYTTSGAFTEPRRTRPRWRRPLPTPSTLTPPGSSREVDRGVLVLRDHHDRGRYGERRRVTDGRRVVQAAAGRPVLRVEVGEVERAGCGGASRRSSTPARSRTSSWRVFSHFACRPSIGTCRGVSPVASLVANQSAGPAQQVEVDVGQPSTAASVPGGVGQVRELAPRARPRAGGRGRAAPASRRRHSSAAVSTSGTAGASAAPGRSRAPAAPGPQLEPVLRRPGPPARRRSARRRRSRRPAPLAVGCPSGNACGHPSTGAPDGAVSAAAQVRAQPARRRRRGPRRRYFTGCGSRRRSGRRTSSSSSCSS